MSWTRSLYDLAHPASRINEGSDGSREKNEAYVSIKLGIDFSPDTIRGLMRHGISRSRFILTHLDAGHERGVAATDC